MVSYFAGLQELRTVTERVAVRNPDSWFGAATARIFERAEERGFRIRTHYAQEGDGKMLEIAR